MTTESQDRETRIETLLDRIISVCSWVWLALIGVITSAVVLRFVFGIGSIELEEMQWHLDAAGFLVGIVACSRQNRHVRVDVLREKLSPRTRDWIDLYGILLLQLPFLTLVLISAAPFALDSFSVAERSASAGGLPYRWLLKGMLPISFGLLLLTTFSQLIRIARRLFRDPPGALRP
ncbi:MAG: TRAP transporter small permease subunit [Myxococcota bacterium]